MQTHAVAKSESGRVRHVTFEELRFLRTHLAYALDVLRQVRLQDASAYALVGDYRGVEESVARPMVAVRFRIDDVAYRAVALDLGAPAHRVAGLLRAIDHYHAVRRQNEAVVTAATVGLYEDVLANLLHLCLQPRAP